MRLSNQDVASSVLGTQGSHCQEQPLFPISYLAILILIGGIYQRLVVTSICCQRTLFFSL